MIAAHQEVLQQLRESKLLEDSEILWLPSQAGVQEEDSGECTLAGFVTMGNHRLKLRVRLPARFPLCMPEVSIDNLPQELALPHLVTGDKICFPEDANLLDGGDPYGIAREALLYARRQLLELLTGHRGQEFAQEAVAYWRGLSLGQNAYCAISGGERPNSIKVFFPPGSGLPFAVADDLAALASALPNTRVDGLRQEEGLYLPLGLEVVEESFLPRELAKLGGLRKYFGALSEEDRVRASLLLGRRDPRSAFLVLGLKRPRGDRALLGLFLMSIQGGHPLETEQATATELPFNLVRVDHGYLAPRGGAGPDLRSRRVLLAGGGAVGGYVALCLARAGIGALTLVDQDLFAPENTYRHTCGMAYLGWPKVEGLRREIQQRTPFVSITPYPMALEALLDLEPSLLLRHDMVISALGHPTIERELNRRIWADRRHPPALFTWLEPLGLGGHVLLTHVKRAEGPEPGCLDCLYSRPIEGGGLRNRASLAEPDATYTRDLLGCGSRYLPYSDLDALRTAELASRLALQTLQGKTTEALLLSWKGDARPFEQEGYRVTPRYAATSSTSEDVGADFRQTNCQTCGAP